jgi:hypothetical protein
LQFGRLSRSAGLAVQKPWFLVIRSGLWMNSGTVIVFSDGLQPTKASNTKIGIMIFFIG